MEKSYLSIYPAFEKSLTLVRLKVSVVSKWVDAYEADQQSP